MSEAPRLWVGTQKGLIGEAGLFLSRDDGASWQEVTGLTDHPSRPHWFPGNGGLCLHSIVHDPDDPLRLWVAISAVGIFRSARRVALGTTGGDLFASEDSGETWLRLPGRLPRVLCVRLE